MLGSNTPSLLLIQPSLHDAGQCGHGRSLTDLLMRCSGKTVDEVWKAIHGAMPNGLTAAAPGGMPPSYESLPLGTLLESLGVMSVEGLGFPLNSVPSYLPPVSQQAGLPPQQPLSIQPLADTQASPPMNCSTLDVVCCLGPSGVRDASSHAVANNMQKHAPSKPVTVSTHVRNL